MVFFNYTTMQVSAKIVYYGPGLCGKTTNLQCIHRRTDPSSRGEMVSLETEADRTLFFDLLPLEVGTIGGMRVRLQLYTVPGQVFYNTTRKLVLKGVDGVVFVADSQVPALDANVESFSNLRQNLAELNHPFEQVPFVFQYNKRDLANIHSVERINRALNPDGYDVFEAAALHGIGVFETLKAISKRTLAAVHRRISGQGARRPQVALPHPVSSRASAVRAEPSRAPTSGAATASAGTGEVRTNTAEVRVEFAASPDAPPTSIRVGPSGSQPNAPAVRRVATRSRLDVEQELEQLRRMAFGGRPPARAKPTAAEAAPSAKAGETQGPIKVRLPRSVLRDASGLSVDLRLTGAGTSHSLPDAVRLALPEKKPGQPTRVKLLIELEED